MAGNAKLTKGYRLPARYIMHTVGPFSHGGQRGEKEPLASCYRRSLELTTANGIASITFPNISTGSYGYPIQWAARIAIATVHKSLAKFTMFLEVTFCCFSLIDLALYHPPLTKT